MGYRLRPQEGDGIQVPMLVMKNLNNGREDYFRVALYLLATGETQPAAIAEALGLSDEETARRALAFWQGAGLLEEIDAAPTPVQKPRLTTREMLLHAGQNPEIALLLQEAQRIFGETVSQAGCTILASMYINDGMSLDYLLLGLTHFAAQGYGANRLGTIQRRLQDWKTKGVATLPQLEAHLALLERRAANHTEVAGLFGCKSDSFTAQESGKIDIWYEQYHYTGAMVSLALGMVGDGDMDKHTVKYINGILRQWHGKGYRQPRDVMAAAQGGNALPGPRRTAAQDAGDVLQKRRGSVPKFRLTEDD